MQREATNTTRGGQKTSKQLTSKRYFAKWGFKVVHRRFRKQRLRKSLLKASRRATAVTPAPKKLLLHIPMQEDRLTWKDCAGPEPLAGGREFLSPMRSEAKEPTSGGYIINCIRCHRSKHVTHQTYTQFGAGRTVSVHSKGHRPWTDSRTHDLR